MAEKIRIGNDIDIRWTLIDENDQPYDLTNRRFEIELVVGVKRIRISDVKVEGADGNTVHFVYYGKDQRHLGSYALKIIENNGIVNMVTFDTPDVFRLVEHSWLAVDTGEKPERIKIEYITLTSSLMERIGPQGPPGPEGPPGPPGPAGTYTAGPGIKIENDVISATNEGNTKSVELTQAEYDALTEEEKNNGTIYFITDAAGGGDATFATGEKVNEVSITENATPGSKALMTSGGVKKAVEEHQPDEISEQDIDDIIYG